MKYTEKITKRLNDLLEKNYDAEKGYQTAANNVNNSALKNYFESRAKERYDFGHELKNEIKLYGETPEKGTSFTADAHRVWMNFRAALSNNDEEAILKETIRGEKSFIKEYNDILEMSSLPESTKRLILKHRSVALSALEDVKKFESIEA
ncbi:PA2169 family four-helix-bundle protein [Aquimarina sp. SS2-1]|uniref:ferritin-like domain-containing protein n=1 Tax=Aquimarina besae TaxID=3342247 RepID=UPI00366C7E6B